MTNHPRRSWRAQLRASLSTWLTTSEARCLIEIPVDPQKFREAMEYRIAKAYEAGYAARKDTE